MRAHPATRLPECEGGWLSCRLGWSIMPGRLGTLYMKLGMQLLLSGGPTTMVAAYQCWCQAAGAGGLLMMQAP
jgi:hypothetical protein